MDLMFKKLKDKYPLTFFPLTWLSEKTIIMEALTGSFSYGIVTDESDTDIAGICIPPPYLVFPWKRGYIIGFDDIVPFDQFQQHHLYLPFLDTNAVCQCDITIYSIVKFFKLCHDNNPNMIDILFSPRCCITHLSFVGEMIIKNREMFLHKGSYHKFAGYAHSQLHKMKSKNREGKRADIIAIYGYDVKFAAHSVRLLLESEQILKEKTLTIDKNANILRDIRDGKWKEKEVINFFTDKEKELAELYKTSDLRYAPDTDAIRKLLRDCLVAEFGKEYPE